MNEQSAVIDLLAIIHELRKKAILIALAALLCGGAAYYYSGTLLPSFESVSTLQLNTQEKSSNQLNQLAALAGLGGGDAKSSDGGYAEYVQSDLFFDSLMQKKWNTQDSQQLDLYMLYKMGLDAFQGVSSMATPEYMRSQALKNILKTTVNVEEESKGVYSILTEAPDPRVAVEMNKAVVELLLDYARTTRYSKASQKRQFVEEQMQEYMNKLNQKEAAMQYFLTQNIVLESPMLILKQGRMQREIDILMAIYTELRKQFELSRMDEKNEQISFTILNQPSIPIFKKKPQKRLYALGGVGVGGFLATFIVLALFWGRRVADEFERQEGMKANLEPNSQKVTT